MKYLNALAALAIVGTGSGATASPNWSKEPIATQAVHYADLDLRSAVDQKRLRSRIAFAAYQLCLVDVPASPSPAVADPACFRAAMRDALARMDRVVAQAEQGATLAGK